MCAQNSFLVLQLQHSHHSCVQCVLSVQARHWEFDSCDEIMYFVTINEKTDTLALVILVILWVPFIC